MTKILIVDDDEAVTRLYGDILTREGFKVLFARNGRDCLRIAAKELPGLILLDVMMPGVDGADTARLLLENEKTGSIPVIFLTGAISASENTNGEKEISGHIFISKSTNIKEFVKRIKGTLGAG